MLGAIDRDIRAMFEVSAFWDEATRLAYQQTQLSQLLLHARANCAFYRNRLDCMFRADGTIVWENWGQIPVLTRQDLQRHGEAMQSTLPIRGHGRAGTSTSSGSTGRPITVKVPPLAIHVASFAWRRFYAQHGLAAGKRFTEFKAFLPNGKPMTKDVLTSQESDNSQRTWINRNLPVEEKLNYLTSTGTKLLADTPNHMEVLANANLRRPDRVMLSKVLGIGMKISSRQELLFKQSFGATTLSPYSSKEGTLMAFQCAHERSNFHMCSELSFAEILDENGRPVPDGIPGRMVITPFFNSSQPLIRYDQGDTVVGGPPCSCGMTLPVLSEIIGRSDSIFRFPGKDIALTRFDDHLVQQALAADAYQFAQVEPLKIVVRYVSPEDADSSGMEKVRSHLLGITHPEVSISFERVSEIPFNAGGKQQRVTREFDVGQN